MPLARKQQERLAELLLKVPPASTFQKRTTLLGDGEGLALNRDEHNAKADFEVIIRQLVNLHAKEALITLIENAIGYVSSTTMGDELRAILREVSDSQPGGPQLVPMGPAAPRASIVGVVRASLMVKFALGAACAAVLVAAVGGGPGLGRMAAVEGAIVVAAVGVALSFGAALAPRQHKLRAPVVALTWSFVVVILGGSGLVIARAGFHASTDPNCIWRGECVARPLSSVPAAEGIPKPDGPVFRADDYYNPPYGNAYFVKDGRVQSARAFPRRKAEMHSEITPRDNGSIPANVVREGYRLTVSNPVQRAATFKAIYLQQLLYEPLPDKYVCVFRPKGLQSINRSDVKLSKGQTRYDLVQGDKFLELKQDETSIFQVNIVDAEPGVYTFKFVAEYQFSDGSGSTLPSHEFVLFVPPAGADKEHKGISVVGAPLPPNVLAQRLLAVKDEKFAELKNKSTPESLNLRSVSEGELSKVLSSDDDEYVVRWFAGKKKDPEVATRKVDYCAATNIDASVAKVCAETDVKNGRVSRQTIRHLQRYLGHAPDDIGVYPLLAKMLMDSDEKEAAKELLQTMRDLGYANSVEGATVSLLVTTQHDSAYKGLLAQARRDYPASMPLLKVEFDFYQNELASLADSVARFCRVRDEGGGQARGNSVRQLIHELVTKASREGKLDFAINVEKIRRSCGSQIAWDLRTDASLWHHEPSARIALEEPLHDLPEAVTVAKSLLAGYRFKGAHKILRSALQRHGPQGDPSAVGTALELLGDSLWLDFDYAAAGKEYLAALESTAAGTFERESRAVKAALSFGRAGDRAGVESVLKKEIKSPKEAIKHKGGDLYVLDPAIQSVASMAMAAIGRNTKLWRVAAVQWVSVDSVDQQRLNDPDYKFTLIDRIGTAVFADAAEGGEWPGVLEGIMEAYLEQPPLFPPYEQLVSDALTRKAALTPYSMASLLVMATSDLMGEEAEPFLIRTRNRIYDGVDLSGKLLISDDKELVRFAPWRERHAGDIEGAAAGVYGEPIRDRPKLAAEIAFRTGLVSAFMNYDMDGGLKLILSSIRDDPLNVSAFAAAAQIAAITGDLGGCKQYAAEARRLDPQFPAIRVLEQVCH